MPARLCGRFCRVDLYMIAPLCWRRLACWHGFEASGWGAPLTWRPPPPTLPPRPLPLLPPRRLGLPDYALLQGAVGAAGSANFQAQAAAAAGMMGGMGGMRGGGTPPLDPASLSAAQVNLAGFGLGGLGNGERAWRGGRIACLRWGGGRRRLAAAPAAACTCLKACTWLPPPPLPVLLHAQPLNPTTPLRAQPQA